MFRQNEQTVYSYNSLFRFVNVGFAENMFLQNEQTFYSYIPNSCKHLLPYDSPTKTVRNLDCFQNQLKSIVNALLWGDDNNHITKTL